MYGLLLLQEKSICIAVKTISLHCKLFMVYLTYKLWNTIDILLDLFLMLHYCKQTDEWVNVNPCPAE